MSFIIQEAASGGTITAQAATAMTGNKPVIVNANGTVDEVGLVVPSGFTQSAGSTTNNTPFSPVESNAVSICKAGTNTFVAFGRQPTTNYPMAVVGTLSGSTFTWGTKVILESSSAIAAQVPALCYDPVNDRVIFGWTGAGGASAPRVAVGSISGTTLTVGSVSAPVGTANNGVVLTYDAINQKVLYSIGTNTGLDSYIGTVSGLTISFGSSQASAVGIVQWLRSAYDSLTGKVVLCYANSSTDARAVVLTLTSTTVTYGSATQFGTSGNYLNTYSGLLDVAYDAASGKFLFAYARIGANNLFASVGTVSGSSISFGTAVTVDTTQQYTSVRCVADTSKNAVLVLAISNGMRVNSCTISGTVPTFQYASAQNYGGATDGAVSALFNSTDSKTYTGYVTGPGVPASAYFSMGTNVLLVPVLTTNLTSENFIGFSDRAYAAGETATIEIIGAVNDGQSGLTPGQSYYVQLDGTLGLSPASPSVFAGTAFATTKLIVKG